MKNLEVLELQAIMGGNSDWITGACTTIGVTTLAGWGASKIKSLAKKALVRTIVGGPVGTALNVATGLCIGYVIYDYFG